MRLKIVSLCFSSGGGHLFCHECVERASSVAIGDGKTELRCLTDCGNVFSINSLQKVLSTAAFSKWLEKIQLADIERVSLFVELACHLPVLPFHFHLNSAIN